MSPFESVSWNQPLPVKARSYWLARLRQSALDMEVADGRQFHAEAELGAFRHTALGGPVRNALRTLRLVEQVRELGASPLETGRVDVRDVVRDDFDVRRLCVHAEWRAIVRALIIRPQIDMRLISWNAATALSRTASAVCSDSCADITASTTDWVVALPWSPSTDSDSDDFNLSTVSFESEARSDEKLSPVPALDALCATPATWVAAPAAWVGPSREERAVLISGRAAIMTIP